MTRNHAILSASGAHRWLNCTPSARLEEPLPDTSSIYAQEGTLAHDLGELELKRLLMKIDQSEYKKQLKAIQSHELYSAEMMGYIDQFATYVMEQYMEAKERSPDAVIFLEQRLDFSRWVPEGFGTGDCTIISDKVMEIIDFKYGKGVEVEAEDNVQMMLYALGALDTYGYIYDIDTVRMTIHQPRIDNVSSWEMGADELLQWADEVLRSKAETAWAGEGEPIPGDWCRFCKVKNRCKARAEAAMSVPSDFDYKDPNLLTVDEIAEILHEVDAIEAWAKDIRDYALVQARDNGVKFKGWKLVEGRSIRRYSDPEQVEKVLRAAKYKVKDIYKPRELKGITDMTKLLGRKKFNELLEQTGLVIKPEGRPTLVPEDDKRPEINSAASDFDL